jgi:hypothetical protein
MPLKEDNIKTVLKEEWVSVAWIHLAQDKDQRRTLVNRSLSNVRYPYKVWYFSTGSATISLLRKNMLHEFR